MKNTIKMSLVAALAVSALSTSASAGSLEEAIKGVDVSGKMEVEYDWTSTNTGAAGATDVDTNGWDYDWDLTAKVPVNDNITAVAGLQADHGTAVNNTVQTNAPAASVEFSSLYFTYANGPVTAMVGKQGMAGAPWFDDEKGNGVVGLYNAGVATIAAAHFTGSNAAPALGSAINTSDISALAIIGSIGPVNASVWYAQLQGITNTVGAGVISDADSYSINLNAKFDIVNVDLTHTSVDYDVDAAAVVDPEAELTKLVVSADFGVATPYIGYGMTNDDQTSVSARGEGVDLTNDNDASTNFGTEQLFIDDLNDVDALLLGVTIPVDAWKFDISYVDGEYSPAALDFDFNEFLVDVEYKMSKNFTIDMFYSTAELQTAAATTQDLDSASIALEYKF